MDRRQFVAGSAAAAAALATQPSFGADSYPWRAITIINAFPPGGANDIVTRPLAALIEPILKQPGDRNQGRRRRTGRRAGRRLRQAGRLYAAVHNIGSPASPKSTSCSAARRNSRAPISSRWRA